MHTHRRIDRIASLGRLCADRGYTPHAAYRVISGHRWSRHVVAVRFFLDAYEAELERVSTRQLQED